MARIAILFIVFCMFAGFCLGDLQADQKECQSQLKSLTTCFGYVQGKEKSPPRECCTNLESVKNSNPKCLCILIKDSATPALGFSINTTLALQMPAACKVDASTSICPALLNLSPSSPDAKIFGAKTNSSSPSSSSGSTPKSMPDSGSTSNVRSLVDTKTHQGLCRMAALFVTVAYLILSIA